MREVIENIISYTIDIFLDAGLYAGLYISALWLLLLIVSMQVNGCIDAGARDIFKIAVGFGLCVSLLKNAPIIKDDTRQ